MTEKVNLAEKLAPELTGTLSTGDSAEREAAPEDEI